MTKNGRVADETRNNTILKIKLETRKFSKIEKM